MRIERVAGLIVGCVGLITSATAWASDPKFVAPTTTLESPHVLLRRSRPAIFEKVTNAVCRESDAPGKLNDKATALQTALKHEDVLEGVDFDDLFEARQRLITGVGMDAAQLPSEPETLQAQAIARSKPDAPAVVRVRGLLTRAKLLAGRQNSERENAVAGELRATYSKESGGATCDDDCSAYLERLCTGSPPRAEDLTDTVVSAVGAGSGVSWEASAVSGLSAFLQSRADAELVQWIENAFQKQLCADAKMWFPSSCALVASVEYGKVSAPAVLMGAALRSDLEEVPWTLLKQTSQVDPALVDDLKAIVMQLRRGDPPLGLLAGLAPSTTGPKVAFAVPAQGAAPGATASLLSVVQAIGKIAKLMGDVSRDARDQPRDLSAYVTELQTFARGACPNAGNVSFSDVCALISNDAQGEKLTNVVSAANALLRRVTAASSSKDASSDQTAADVAKLTLDFCDRAVDLIGPPPQVAKQWRLVRDSAAAGAAVGRGDYVSGLSEVLLAAHEANADHGILPATAVQYLPLIIDLASAKTPADAEGALNAAAAPVGSWRIKRRAFTVSLSAIVGGSVVSEMPTENGKTGSPAAGAMMAVGLDFAWPVQTWTFGGFVSLLDPGQLASLPVGYRTPQPETNGSNLSSKPVAGTDFQIAQVLSPGLYFRIGAGNTPITFGGGAAYAPVLRQYAEFNAAGAGQGTQLASEIRLGVFLAIDVTILPFFP